MRKLFVLLLALGVCGVAAVAAPVISVDSSVYVVTVQSGSLVKHSFVITNSGDEPLTLTNVRTSCGCATTALAKRDLAPSESVNLDATVNTSGFHGTVTRTITVSSNDPASPTTILRFEITIADVEPVVPEISAGDLRMVFYMLIDVRTPDEYATGHLIGALNVSLADIRESAAAWAARLPHDIPIVLYGTDTTAGHEAAALLLTAGLPSVFSLTGGITGWDAAFGQGILYAP